MEPADLTDDALTGGYRVYQRRRGHRYSLDDCITAREGARALSALLCHHPADGSGDRPVGGSVDGSADAPADGGGSVRILDLGCGLGSVLLMLAYKFPGAELVGVEAQAESFALAGRNVARNGVTSRVTLHQGDLRDPALLARLGGPFALITGTPPYQPPGCGTISPDSQRAHARVELCGGIEAYVQAAAGLLAPTGRLVVCVDARAPQRLYRSARAAGLQPLCECAVSPAARYKGPLFCVWTLAPRGPAAPGHAPLRRSSFVARDASGARTRDAHALRAFFDLSINPGEPDSPRQRHRQPQEHGPQHPPSRPVSPR